jgi:hypothetical protein
MVIIKDENWIIIYYRDHIHFFRQHHAWRMVLFPPITANYFSGYHRTTSTLRQLPRRSGFAVLGFYELANIIIADYCATTLYHALPLYLVGRGGADIYYNVYFKVDVEDHWETTNMQRLAKTSMQD